MNFVSHIIGVKQAEELMRKIEKEEEQISYDDPEKKVFHLCIVNLVIGWVSDAASYSLILLEKHPGALFLASTATLLCSPFEIFKLPSSVNRDFMLSSTSSEVQLCF